MIIAGAGSAGKETSGILMLQSDEDLIFYDSNHRGEMVWDKFNVYSKLEEIEPYLQKHPDFCVAIGNPRKRKRVYDSFLKIGALPANIISKNANILSNITNNGTIIQPGVCISYDVKVGKSCFIHANSVIGHKVQIGDFVNISPLCSLIGPCTIGSFTYIGARTIVMPNIRIGSYSYISPGSIVNRDIDKYETF
jgi:sugar O-acyltransferase (sialic acid O-acetyltransferase NeuD family)